MVIGAVIRLPSTLCIYSRTVQNQESFFSFDPLNGTGKLLATVEGGPFNWTLSPDGKYIATVKRGFQTDFGIVQTDPGIQILSIADGSKRTIPATGWAGITSVDWSADGKSLVATGASSRLAGGAYSPTWSPDDKPMIFSRKMRGNSDIFEQDP